MSTLLKIGDTVPLGMSDVLKFFAVATIRFGAISEGKLEWQTKQGMLNHWQAFVNPMINQECITSIYIAASLTSCICFHFLKLITCMYQRCQCDRIMMQSINKIYLQHSNISMLKQITPDLHCSTSLSQKC